MKNDNRNKSGGILVLVMVLLIAISILNIGTIHLGTINAVDTARSYSSSQALWLAEAGLEELKAVVNKPINRRPIESLGYGSISLFDLSGTLDTGDYTVLVDYDPSFDNSGVIRHYIIQSTGTSLGGESTILTLKTESETFANYVHSSNSEGNVSFATGDILEGQVYTNDRLNINGTPQFMALVRSAGLSINYANPGAPTRSYNYIDPSVFLVGITLGAPTLDFGTTVDHIGELKADAGLVLGPISGNYSIVFDQHQYYLTAGTTTTTNNIPSGKVIYVNDSINVQGIIDDRVSIAAEGAIYIIDDITYSSAPDPDWNKWPDGFEPESDNALGLFSKKEVEIINNDRNDINIHAAILTTAPIGSPARTDMGFGTTDRYNNIGRPDINLYGSVAQYERGIVGTTGGDGYLKKYRFDARNYATPPPGTPYSVYKFSEWKPES
jgi:hypothetical protein